MTPRGIRNNNPLNIRRSADEWQGLCRDQTDREFFQFETMQYGLRAALITLRTYIQKHRLTCIRQIIRRWAPPEDGNDTDSYIRTVCRIANIESLQPLDWNDKPAMMALVQAMGYVECGKFINLTIIKQAYEMC